MHKDIPWRRQYVNSQKGSPTMMIYKNLVFLGPFSITNAT